MKVLARSYMVAAMCALVPVFAYADTITTGNTTVDASANIYAAGTQSGYATGGNAGTVPDAITVTGSTYLTFSSGSPGQTITLNGGPSNNDMDGSGSEVGTGSSNIGGYGSISGLDAPGAGYLVGVFIGAGGPGGAAPTALNYTGSMTTGESSYSPLLDQAFFIGDGLTGDGSGATQTFEVPVGATELYFGISDAGGYNGTPGSYGDNHGSFSVNYSDVTVPSTGGGPSATPEPSSLALLGTCVLGAAATLRRRLLKR